MSTALRSIPARRGRLSRLTALLMSAAMTSAVAVSVAAPAASAEPEFTTSFESGDTQPLSGQGYGEPTNVTGDRFAAGSVLSLVTGVEATGSSPNGEGPVNLADGISSSKWLTFASTGTVTYEFAEPVAITEYALTSANDTPGRDPRVFTLEGSVDGESWTELDSQDGQAWAEPGNENRFVTKNYALDERSAEYTFYRLDVIENNGEGIVQLADWDLLDDQREQVLTPLAVEVAGGPSFSYTAKTGVGFTGVNSLEYAGRVVSDGDASAASVLFDVDVSIADDSQLSYKIFPVLDARLDYASTHVAVDLLFDDGSLLSDTAATDAYGFGIGAADQGESNVLYPDQWNSVTVDLGAVAGRTVEQVLLSYDQPGAAADTSVLGYVDDIALESATPLDTSDGLVSYVDTRRGTNSNGGYSRGNNLPAAAWPNGFNFVTPMTNAQGVGTMYHYQRENDADNLPGLTGIGFSHQPSIWMGDRNQLAVLPADGSDPSSTLSERRLPFRHENETARPDIYEVEFENGITTAATPTDHGVIYEFSFTGDEGSVLVDKVEGDSGLTVAADGSVSGWVDGGSGYPGRTRMFVAGQFDATPIDAGATQRGNRNGSARFAAFDTSADATVELRLASSFISQDQAQSNLDMEVTGRSFDEIHTDVRDAWNDRLSVITDVQGATDAELVNLYSGLYRLNLYPNSQFENTGTPSEPVYQYASPVSPTTGSATATETNAEIVDGKIYVNNGFWDTYRTAWPMYALLYPDLTEELVDGFVQQYRDGGWVARWSSPGYADLMTGTSSDVAFAEAYLAGSLSTELALEAYDAALKNATALPASNAVGRKGLDQSIFLGYTQSGTHESASWGLEGFINDYGIAEMAAALAADPETPSARVAALEDEAEYFAIRAQHFAEMYNPEAGVFTARDADGSWPVGADFDKKEWGGAFTESSGWTFAFHAPHDVDGMAALYGSRQALLDELDEFLTTPELADRSGIHEAREARDVRLGMLGMSNQVAHHIPYVLAEAGDPSGAQELIREIQQRLFVGSDIGQGYPGDEDNGEMSAWFIFSALGFYPLEVGSGDYTIGSPQFDSVTVNLGGEPLTINAPGAGDDDDVYVAGVDINGTSVTETTFDGDLIRDGGTMTFAMSDSPSSWGAKDLDEELESPETHVDASAPELGTLTAEGGTAVGALVDDTMRSSVLFDGTDATLTWTSSSGPVAVDSYTLTSTDRSGASDPSSWTLSASSDGSTWTTLDTREDEVFPFATQTRPFSVAGEGAGFTQFRLELSAAEGDLGLSEIELFAEAAGGAELTASAADDKRVRVGDELTGSLATIVGEDFSPDSGTVTVNFGDGSATVEADLSANGLGGWTASAPHTFAEAGVYTVTVVATDANGGSASASLDVTAYRDDTLVGAFNNICIGDLGSVAASCDGQGYGYFRDKLADSGFVQGDVIPVPGTEVSFALPDIAPGEPDNVTGEGQTFSIDLGEGATQISLIGTATESGKDLEATLTFTDGTEQTIPLQFGDWVGASGSPAFGNIVVGLSEGRLAGTEPESTVKNTAMYATAPFDLAVDGDGQAKTVATLTLPQEEGTLRADGRAHLFAVASDGDLDAPETLTVTASEVPPATVGMELTAELASVESESDSLTATINWADGTATDSVDVVDGIVSGTHTYDEVGDYSASVTVDDGVRSETVSVEIEVVSGYEPTLTIEPTVARPGEDITVTGTGFAPGEEVTVTFGSQDPQTVTATDQGDIEATVASAADAPDGVYPIIVWGTESQAEARGEVRIEAEVAGPVVTSTVLEADTSSPVVGEQFSLTATVSPADAEGTVEFYDGGTLVGTAAVSGGTASVDVRPESSGTHVYSASFVPTDDEAFGGSASQDLTLDVRTGAVEGVDVDLSDTTVEAGDTLTVTATGFEPGETVRVELHSEPVDLGQGAADESGTLVIDVVIPAGTAAGEHTIVAFGTSSELVGEAALTVLAADGAGGGDGTDGGAGPDGDGLSSTGANVGWLLAIAALLLVLGAGGLGLRYVASRDSN